MRVAEDLLVTNNPPASWIAARGEAALEQLRQQGLPHRRLEDWKYSDLREALNVERPSTIRAGAANPFAELGYASVEFVDGAPAKGLDQLPAGIEAVDLLATATTPAWVESLLGTLVHDGLSGAALALMNGGIALRVPSGMILEEPIGLFFRSGSSHHLRLLLLVEEGAEVSLIEHHAHQGRLANIGFEIVLMTEAKLRHVRLSHSADDSSVIETIGMTQDARSTYHAHFADLGARLSRLELQLSLKGHGTQTELSGIQVLAPGLHSDVTTRLTHRAGRTASAQLFKQVLAGRARAAYQGRITVAEGADGTDSRQSAKAILLDTSAEADLKPELIIFADDVQCAHGAAIGDLDADALFYLRARGLDEQEARSLLLRAFLEDVISTVSSEPIKSCLWKAVDGTLAAAGVIS